MKTERLGDLATFLSGFAFKSNLFNDGKKGTPIIRIRDVIRGRSETYFSGEYDERYLVKKGDYLIGMDGEFNLARWNSEPALLNQRVCKIDSLSRTIDRAYLGRFLPAALKKIEDATPFVTVKHLSVKTLNEIEIPLPPLAEQKRIAAILDAADALRAKRREALSQLDALLQSTFLNLFGDPVENPKKIKTAKLGSLCVRVTDGTHQSPKWADAGHPFLFVSNIVTGVISFETKKFISDATHAELTRRCPIERGDVLYSTVGSYGVPAVVRTEQKFAFQRHIAHLKPNKDLLDSEFLAAMLASPPLQRQADRAAKGVAQKTVNLAEISKFIVFAPPLALQQKFTAIVESIERQKTTQRAHLAELDALFAALQHRAFRGEL